VGMTDAIDLTQEQRNQLSALLRRFLPGVAVWAYGSRVKWTARPNSDLDLVAFTTPAQSPQVAELKDALAESNLPFPVDLHVWDDVPERFREIIRKEYVVVQEAKQPEDKPSLPIEWQRHEVSKLLADGKLVVGDGYRAKNSELSRTGLPFARAGNINNGFQFAEADHFPSDALSRVGNKVSQPGDVVFTSKGTVGRFAFVREDTRRFVYSPQLCFWRSLDQALIQSRFLYYWMHGSEFFAQFKGVAGQTDMAEYVSLTDQRRMHITLPSLPEQRAIAHILGTLDDKIELNRRMDETLEAMARVLFKSWFVDFDPVRAKAEGRDSGLPKPLADLFPDSFEDSEMGEIPKGWEVRSIYEIADVVYGAPFASSQFNTEGIGEPLIRIRDLADESPGVWTPEVHPKGYKVRPGDIVVGMDGEFRAYLWGGAEAWLNQRVCVFLPKGDYTAAFVRNSIIEPLAHVESTETATTVIHLGKSDIDRFCVVAPTASVLAAFNQSCQPWYDRIVAAKRETRTLAALRDTLLPKLISGELRVKDAERFVEAAT
jgi:type I restriction enzyme S subunit